MQVEDSLSEKSDYYWEAHSTPHEIEKIIPLPAHEPLTYPPRCRYFSDTALESRRLQRIHGARTERMADVPEPTTELRNPPAGNTKAPGDMHSRG